MLAGAKVLVWPSRHVAHDDCRASQVIGIDKEKKYLQIARWRVGKRVKRSAYRIIIAEKALMRTS